jgi:hypothetical protein
MTTLPNCGMRNVDCSGRPIAELLAGLGMTRENVPFLSTASSSTSGRRSSRGMNNKNLNTGLFVLPESAPLVSSRTQYRGTIRTQHPLLGIHKHPGLRLTHAPPALLGAALGREFDRGVVQDLGFDRKRVKGLEGGGYWFDVC